MVDLVGRYVQLKRGGASHKGLCPFHQEKTPSFHVRETHGSFHCFGCDEGGDCFAFLQKIDGMNFVEAVTELATRSGVPLPKEDLSPQERAQRSHKELLLKANDLACHFFEQCLAGPQGEAARTYLEQRGYGIDFARRFRLGFAPDSWDGAVGALRAAGLKPEIGEAAGLLIPRKGGSGHYDRFRNRLMFPITDVNGKVIAFGGRTLGDDDAKYINSPETEVYEKSAALYGLHPNRSGIQQADLALVVEGYFDVLGLAKAGLEFGVAPCGTALTEKQLRVLRRRTQRIVLLFDSDAAGQRAAMRSLEVCLGEGIYPSYLKLPEGKDPDDFVQSQGPEAMQALLEKRRPLLDAFVEQQLESLGQDAADLHRILSDLAPLLRQLEPLESDRITRRIASGLGADPQVVAEQLRRAKRTAPTARSRPRTAAPAEADGPPAPPSPPLSLTELEFLRLLVQDLPQLAPLVHKTHVLDWLHHPEVKAVATLLLALHAEGRRPTAQDLLTDLPQGPIRLGLSRLLGSEEHWYTDEVLQVASQECLIRLRSDWARRQITRLNLQLSQIEHNDMSDPGLLSSLSNELQSLHIERSDLKNALSQLLRDTPSVRP